MCLMDLYSDNICDISSWTLKTQSMHKLWEEVGNKLRDEGSGLIQEQMW